MDSKSDVAVVKSAYKKGKVSQKRDMLPQKRTEVPRVRKNISCPEQDHVQKIPPIEWKEVHILWYRGAAAKQNKVSDFCESENESPTSPLD